MAALKRMAPGKLSFPELQEIIRGKAEKEQKDNLKSYRKGMEREKRFKTALISLKKEGKIRDFSFTGRITFSDVKKGIDFYVIIVRTKYDFFRFSVTGERWVEEQKKEHPDNTVFPVELGENFNSLKERIMAVLKSGGSA